MGVAPSKYLMPHLWREDEPDTFAPLQYHPQFGFDGKREKKQIIATQEEMDSANMEPSSRDYCAHIKIQFRGCIRYHQPFWYKCKGYLSELEDCYLEERIHDMKEFERERRLNARERRLRESSS